MVVLSVKSADCKNDFSFECRACTRLSELVCTVSLIHDLMERCKRLAAAVLELGKHGPIRPVETRGLSAEVCELSKLEVSSYGESIAPDDLRQRTGCPPDARLAEILVRTAVEAIESLNSPNAKPTVGSLQTSLKRLRGSVMVAYPANHRLPAYDPVRIELDSLDSDIPEKSPGGYVLWWVGKPLALCHGKETLGDYIGTNEKTRVVVRLQPAAAGPPMRESRIDTEAHNNMLKYYHKRQEELKQLDEDDDDAYLNSKWTDPRGLKQALVGNGGGITWKF